jgi:hypothetical protein
VKYKGRRTRRDDTGKVLEVMESFDIFFNTKHPWKDAVSKNDKPKLLSSFADFKSDFPSLLNHWYDNVSRYREAAGLYYDNLALGQQYNPLRFLTTAQAVETAHRRLFGDTTFTAEEARAYRGLRHSFNELLESINQIEERHKQDLKEKMIHLPQTKLQARLTELWTRAESVVRTAIPDEEGFNRSARNSRNYYTHYTKNLASRAAKDWELVKLTVQLEALLIATILLELGVQQETISRLFEKHYKWISQLS